MILDKAIYELSDMAALGYYEYTFTKHPVPYSDGARRKYGFAYFEFFVV